MIIYLERSADLHMAQLMPLPLTVCCFSKIQIGFTFVVPAHLGSPVQRAIKWVCLRRHQGTDSVVCTAHTVCGDGSIHLRGIHLFVSPVRGHSSKVCYCGPASRRYRSIAAGQTAAWHAASECGNATLSVYIVAEHRPAFTVMLCRRWSLRLLVKADAGRWRHRG